MEVQYIGTFGTKLGQNSLIGPCSNESMIRGAFRSPGRFNQSHLVRTWLWPNVPQVLVQHIDCIHIQTKVRSQQIKSHENARIRSRTFDQKECAKIPIDNIIWFPDIHTILLLNDPQDLHHILMSTPIVWPGRLSIDSERFGKWGWFNFFFLCRWW